MRRIFYALPVAVLGAGGLLWWHHEARPPAPQARQGLRMRDGRTYYPPTPGSAPVTAGSAGTPTSDPANDPGIDRGSPTTPSAPSSATPAATVRSSGPTIVAPSEAVARPEPLTQRERFEETNSLVGENRKLAVPVPGVDKARKKMGAVAACQGPQADQHYATLTGKARSDFARACARLGVTLAP